MCRLLPRGQLRFGRTGTSRRPGQRRDVCTSRGAVGPKSLNHVYNQFIGEGYIVRRNWDYLVEHLTNEEPPDEYKLDIDSR